MHRNFSLMIHKKILTMYGGGLIDKLCSTLATPWTVSHQVPLSMGFSRQDYWNGLSFSSPGDLPNPGLLNCRPILYHLSHQGSPKQKRPQCIDQESNWVSHVIGENSTTEPPMPLLKGFLKE